MCESRLALIRQPTLIKWSSFGSVYPGVCQNDGLGAVLDNGWKVTKIPKTVIHLQHEHMVKTGIDGDATVKRHDWLRKLSPVVRNDKERT